MLTKTLILFVLLSLNLMSSFGQSVYYDYDDSGNRVRRYIIPLKKAVISGEDTSKGTLGDSKVEDFEEKFGDLIIKIYPNPTQGQLSVLVNGLAPDEKVDYQLFSQSGLLLDTKRRNGFQFAVDMEGHPAGMYILRLMIKGRMRQWKILKE